MGATLPIGSMHGILTYMYDQNQPNVGKYTSPMDPMGYIHSRKKLAWNGNPPTNGSLDGDFYVCFFFGWVHNMGTFQIHFPVNFLINNFLTLIRPSKKHVQPKGNFMGPIPHGQNGGSHGPTPAEPTPPNQVVDIDIFFRSQNLSKISS